jgi:hypothetical protein
MKKIIFAFLLPLITLSALGYTIGGIKNDIPKKSISKPISEIDNKVALKKWEATPDGIAFKKWEESAAGKKVYASEAKIRKSLRDFTNMDAVVSSLSLPLGSRLGYGMMVKINEEDYILSFGPEFNKEFEKLHNINVGDKILIKSHSVSHAPKYAYPIVAGDYIELGGKVLYKRVPKKGGC